MNMRIARIALLLAAGAAAFTAHAAQQQLDDHCVVSILNRTAQVRADGTWSLPNIPSTTGLVRARVTCTANGITRTGQSELFAIPTFGGAFTNDFIFDTVTPVPLSLALSAPTTSLGVGASVSLQAVATYNDGSTAVVTPASTGTQYNSTNANVVSVSADGVATARSSGTAIIAATHESSLALIRITVAVTNDSDGDGLPDDYELANGFNPNDPTDAAKDADGDGLTNLQEFLRGTNPRAYDSDGDGIGDGLEVQTGTNPLDPSSFDFGRTLQSMSATPNPINVYVNSIYGRGAAGVSITGTLIDGHAVDLTSRSRGTTYSIDNTAAASLSSVDGQVVGLAAGFANLTVTNATFRTVVPVTVTAFTPSLIASVPVTSTGPAAAVAGNYLYLAAGQNGLWIFDVTNRLAPQLVGKAMDSYAVDVRVAGTLAYVADINGGAGIDVYDVSIPTAPRKIAGRALASAVFSLAVANGVIYAGTSASVDILRASDLTTLASVPASFVRSIDIDPTGTTVAYASSPPNFSFFGVIDVTNPAAPVAGGVLQLTNVKQVRVIGQYAYVSEDQQNSPTVRTIDISRPSAPLLLSTSSNFIVGQLTYGIARAGLVFAGGNTPAIIGLLDATEPRGLGVLNPIPFSASVPYVTALAADAQYLYAFLRDPNSSSQQLGIVRYLQVQDTLGRPPSVQIASPANGTTVVEGSDLLVDTRSNDDVEVDSIDLYANARLVHSAKAHQVSFHYVVPIGATSVALQAKSPDFGGNVGQSAVVSLNVLRDTTAPVVSIVSPVSGTVITAGQNVTVTVSATDNARVAAVDLYRDGNLVTTLTAAPYTFTVFIPTGITSTVFTAKATDPAGNANTSVPVTLLVGGDQPPVVSIASPTSGAGLYMGAEVNVVVNATDDIGVRGVDLLVDGVRVYSTFGPPWVLPASLPANEAAPRISARATDSAGHVTTSAEVTLNVAPTSPIAATLLPGPAVSMTVSGRYAYMAAGKKGLVIADVSQITAPAVVSTLTMPDTALSVAVAGHYAFLADSLAGLQVADVNDPLNPVIVGALPMPGVASFVSLNGDRAYVATEGGLHILDIRNPRVPVEVSFIATPATARSIRVAGTRAYLLYDIDDTSTRCFRCVKLRILDISVETAPLTYSTTVVQTGYGYQAVSLFVDGNTAYIDGADYIVALDVSNPSNVRQVGAYDQTNFLHCCWYDMRTQGKTLFVAHGEGGPFNDVAMFDASDPAHLSYYGRIDFKQLGFNFSGLAVVPTPELVYATGDASGGRPPNFDQPPATRLVIGRWNTVQDTAGIPPQVSVVAPAAGSTFYAQQAMPIRITATDDVNVASVSIFVDGQLVSTQTTAPFTFWWDVPAGPSQHTITATATDFGGNESSSSPVTVNVMRDITAPTVRVSAPPLGGSVLGPSVVLRAAAADDFSVASVTLLVDGQPVATLTRPPYELVYAIPPGTLSFTVGATATDPAGNVGTAAEQQVTVVPGQLLGTIDVPSQNRVAVNGHYAYVATSTSGLVIVDIADPAAPVIVSTLPMPNGNPAFDVRLNGNHAFIAANGALVDVDVTDPAAPVIARSLLSAGAQSLDLVGTKAYTVAGGTFSVYDLSDPAAFTLLDRGSQGGTSLNYVRATGVYGIGMGRDFFSNSILQEWDTSKPLNTFPVIGNLDQTSGRPTLNGSYGPFTITDDRLVAPKSNGLLVATLAPRPISPVNVSDPVGLQCAADSGDLVLAGERGGDALAVYDVSNRANPIEVGTVSMGAVDVITSIAATPTLAVAASDRLYIARYRTFTDTFGTAPNVQLGATRAVNGKYFAIKATVNDDVAVASVTFTVNGVDVFTDTVAPFELNYLAPAGSTSLTVSARATDFGGNVGTSGTLNVPVASP